MINDSIPNIITLFQTRYYGLTYQELSEKEDTLKVNIYDPQQPVNFISNKIKIFSDLCTVTKNNKSDRKLVQLGYLIINQTKSYMGALKIQHIRAAADKIYNNFNIHLWDEYHSLRQVRALKIADSSIYAEWYYWKLESASYQSEWTDQYNYEGECHGRLFLTSERGQWGE